MPFGKNPLQGTTQPISTSKDFTGRDSELRFFVQNILKPENLADDDHIIFIEGQGGVGKTTLLLRYIEEASKSAFKEYCLTALVDNRQKTPITIIEKLSEQLGILEGELRKVFNRYKEALRNTQTEHKNDGMKTLSKLASGAGESVPIVGPFARDAIQEITQPLVDKHHNEQARRNEERLERAVEELTSAFVKGLNALADQYVMTSSFGRRQRRVILFLDTFEKLGKEASPWLLDHFLEKIISDNVVLVIAERDSRDRREQWVRYKGPTRTLALKSFTEEETYQYLKKHDITDSNRVENIWHLSLGLPLYLYLYTMDPQGKDQTDAVVTNFLRWIDKQEKEKRQLALHASLFSRAFNRDDLEAFVKGTHNGGYSYTYYLSESELPDLYKWLTEQHFVKNEDAGRYSYDKLAQEFFSRYLYQHSSKDHESSRKTLANYYEKLLRELQPETDKKVLRCSKQRLELEQALIYQWFLLTDETYQIKAAEQTLKLYEVLTKKQTQQVISMLGELLQKRFPDQSLTRSQRMVQLILKYIETNERQEFLKAADALLEQVGHLRSFSPTVLGRIYYRRAKTYLELKQYQEAIADFTKAAQSDTKDEKLYYGRGMAYLRLKSYKSAMEDFQRVLKLNPDSARAYDGLVAVYVSLNEYQQGIEEFNRRQKRHPRSALVLNGRGWINWSFHNYQDALKDFNQAIELKPSYADAYYGQGQTYLLLQEYRLAIESFTRTIKLNPAHPKAYTYRGLASLQLGNLPEASKDFFQSWEQDSSRLLDGLMAEWLNIYERGIVSGTAERLEMIAKTNPKSFAANICLAVALWTQGKFPEAQKKLELTAPLNPTGRDVYSYYFWKGMIHVHLNEGEQAKGAFDIALKLGLPPVLLLALRWFSRDNTGFYKYYAEPLLVRHKLLQSATNPSKRTG